MNMQKAIWLAQPRLVYELGRDEFFTTHLVTTGANFGYRGCARGRAERTPRHPVRNRFAAHLCTSLSNRCPIGDFRGSQFGVGVSTGN